MLQSIDRAIKCDPEDPRLHNYIVRFLSRGENIIDIGAGGVIGDDEALCCSKENVSIDRLILRFVLTLCCYLE